jgi:hypothetical protein
MTKNNRIAARVISMILGILMGVALVVLGSVIRAETLVWLALVIWGIIIAVSNIPGLIYAIANLKAKGEIFDLVASAIGILLGLGLIFSQSSVITVILAAYMIVFPIVRVALAKSAWADQLGKEALRIVLGVLLLVFGGALLAVGYKVLNLILSIIGWVVIALTVILGALDILRIATAKDKPASDEPIYVDFEKNSD